MKTVQKAAYLAKGIKRWFPAEVFLQLGIIALSCKQPFLLFGAIPSAWRKTEATLFSEEARKWLLAKLVL